MPERPKKKPRGSTNHLSDPNPIDAPPEPLVIHGAPSDEPEGPSKTQRKNQMHKLQALGERLVQLKEPYLLGLGLSDSLLDAITEAKRIKGHGAIRRQNQLIGKLMRDVDIEPIEKFFAARQFSK